MIITPNQIQAFETPGAAWRWACEMINRFGQKVVTEDGQTTKEIRNLVLQVQNPDLGWPISGSNWDIPALEVYYQDQIIGTENPTGFSYIYGQRIAPHLAPLIAKLKAQPESRRAVISLWHDSDYDIQHPPCWMVLEFLIRGDQLHLTAFIRSNDMLQAWPANAYGLSKLLSNVASEVGCETGSLTTISASAHIYIE
ncbi:thymidylate synthase [Candidatus Pacearchaeota archaeon]|jgi:thymidylate synthase|nr:thymidylate synthase [Candidatus Pacearchaeota archaeon]